MTLYWFKLRRNITMDGDLQLARLELEALAGKVDDIQQLSSADFPSMPDFTRNGQQGYAIDGDIHLLPSLISRLTFIQHIFCITDDSPQIRQQLNEIAPVLHFREHDGKLYIEAIPHYALFEFAEVIARKAKIHTRIPHQLSALLDGLLGRCEDRTAQKLIETVMSAQITSAPLSHGIHYYKAKFFPRMARAMLNITAGNQHRSDLTVLDPFVGSGTTLLEASQLGMSNTGIDIDPLSVLISQKKLDILATNVRTLQTAQSAIQAYVSTSKTITEYDITFPQWLTKNRKMTDDMARQLITEMTTLRDAVAQVDHEVQDIFRVILSDAITRRIRFRFMGTGVGRFSLTFSKATLDQLFFRAVDQQINSLVAWEWLRDTLNLSLSESQVMQGDARQMANLPHFDLMVTSPPYLPASSGRESYAKARTPSLLALGIEDADSVDTLIDTAVGSMDEKISDDYHPTDAVQHLVSWLENDTLRQPKALPTARYFHDMRQTFAQMKQHLNDNGKIVLVSGRQSTFYRSKTREILYCVPVAEMLAQEAEHAGLVVDQLVHIPLKKANRNARPRSLDDYDETLIFLSK